MATSKIPNNSVKGTSGYLKDANEPLGSLEIINGWGSPLNVPTDATGGFSLLITAWVYPESAGRHDDGVMMDQVLITHTGKVYKRRQSSQTGTNWSEWATAD